MNTRAPERSARRAQSFSSASLQVSSACGAMPAETRALASLPKRSNSASVIFQAATAFLSVNVWPTMARMPVSAITGAIWSISPRRSAMQVTPFSRNSAQAARTEAW
jgi:hypothetical protein